MCDGEIVAAIQEERFCRKKNYVGYPKESIDYCLGHAGITGKELHRAAFTTTSLQGLFIKAKTSTQFSIKDYMQYYGERHFQRKLRGEECSDYYRWLNEDPKFNQDHQYYDFSYLTDEVINDARLDIELFRKVQARTLAGQLGIPVEKVEFLDHHTCHAYYSYFASPYREKECIVVTLDGWGDGRNQTVWKVANDRFELLADSAENDIGRVYKMATLLLGMRPDEHEFKVMGLAPYAKDSYIRKSYQVIEEISDVKGMRIVAKNRPADLYGYLKEAWADHRFDNVAGAVQYYAENLATRLVENIAKETGVSRFVLGGGISMNVKMNKAVSELDCVSELFVCGSGGDESLSIGGCYVLNEGAPSSKPVPHLHLGYDVGCEMAGFDWEGNCAGLKVRKGVTHAEVAQLLVRGDIISVLRGRAEFGARALGNRSILADPSRRASVIKINEAIKNRDFWMPFALSILEDRHKEYLLNPKDLCAPFMSTSFDTLEEKYPQIEAGTHPYDKTVRPQLVSRDTCPQYYSLITEFCKLTGIPAVLNTSFNLHGEPIVNSISDAIRTFRNSGLDHLLINDEILISK